MYQQLTSVLHVTIHINIGFEHREALSFFPLRLSISAIIRWEKGDTGTRGWNLWNGEWEPSRPQGWTVLQRVSLDTTIH